MPVNEPDPAGLKILGMGAILGALAWLARQLMSGRSMALLRLVGGMLGAALSSFSFGALLIGASDSIRGETLLGMAGVVGWVGGDAMAAMARWLGQRLGLPLED